MKDRNISQYETIDFINDPEARKFLHFKMYTRKFEDNQYETSVAETISSERRELDRPGKPNVMSLFDLIVKIDKFSDQMSEETYQLATPKFRKQDSDQM